MGSSSVMVLDTSLKTTHFFAEKFGSFVVELGIEPSQDHSTIMTKNKNYEGTKLTVIASLIGFGPNTCSM